MMYSYVRLVESGKTPALIAGDSRFKSLAVHYAYNNLHLVREKT